MCSSKPNGKPTSAGATTSESASDDIKVQYSGCGDIEVPEWVTNALNISKEEVAVLEVLENNKRRYYACLDFVAHRAVDAWESGDPVPDPEREKTAGRAKREYTGRLSKLTLPDPDDHEPLFSRRRMQTTIDGFESESEDDEFVAPSLHFGLGNARLKFEDRDVCVMHTTVEQKLKHENSACRGIYFFAKSPKTLRSLALHMVRWYFERFKSNREIHEGKYELYTMRIQYDEAKWIREGWKASRSLDSVFLPSELKSAIVDDFTQFSSKGTKDWFRLHGLPYRRSYMFYGEPGLGKTSMIRALAGEFGLAACFLSLGDRNIGNSQLQDAIRTIPCPAMLVIEDVDALFNEDRETNDFRHPLTFSTVLNVLDGLSSKDGVLTVMTSNHIEKLDPALIRGGRVDRKFEFCDPDAEQIMALFKSFYPKCDEKSARKFADIVFERPEKSARSIATLQQHFIITRGKSEEECVNTLDSFFDDFGFNDEFDFRSMYAALYT